MRIIIMSAYKETFFPMPMPRKDAPLQLLLAGITHPDPAYRIVRHSPTDLYVLEYVIRGKGHLYWGDKYYRPSGGDVYLLQPPLSHAYHSDAADPWEKIWFNLSGPLIGALCDAYRLRGIGRCPMPKICGKWRIISTSLSSICKIYRPIMKRTPMKKLQS